LYKGIKKHVLIGYICEQTDYNRFYPDAMVSRQHETTISPGTGADPLPSLCSPNSHKAVPEILIKKVRKDFLKF
jgi:hypothetical protein